MDRKSFTPFLLLTLFFPCLGLSQQIPPLVADMGYADLILVNGKVVTMDDRSTTANSPGNIFEAMAVKGKKVMALGGTEGVRTLAGPKTKTIDLEGKTLVPGFIETHAHPYGTAMTRYGPQVGLTTPDVQLSVETQASAEETVKVIRATIANAIQRQNIPEGEWITVSVQNSDKAPQNAAGMWFYVGTINRQQIDGTTREYPVILRTGLRNIYNSKAIEELKKVFTGWEEHTNTENRPGAARDGYDGIMTNVAIGPEFWWRNEPLEKFAEALRLHGLNLREWGVTTLSTRIPPPKYIGAYHLLNREGRMPYRLAWSIEVHRGTLADLQFTRDFYWAIGAQWKTMSSGNDMLWNHGMTNEIWDSLNLEMCFGPDLSAPQNVKEQERCPGPGSKPWVAYKAAILNGWRPVGSHGTASHGARLFIQMLDETVEEGNLSAEYIRSLRPTLEHAVMIGTPPDVMAGLKKYGIMLSTGPRFMFDALRTIQDYGEEALQFVAPIKTYLREGIKVVNQMDSTNQNENSNMFTALYTLISRKVFNWNEQTEDKINAAPVLLPEEAIDRATAMKMITTWAAEYVLAEDNLGSLEPGKYADFVVLDRDYFTIPESEILKVRAVMTGLNGQIIYDRDGMADASN